MVYFCAGIDQMKIISIGKRLASHNSHICKWYPVRLYLDTIQNYTAMEQLVQLLNMRGRVFELPQIKLMSRRDQIKVNKCTCRLKVSIASFTTTH